MGTDCCRGGFSMIANGLCLMGGCFAQQPDSSVVDTYWPAESVPIPTIASGNIGVYQYVNPPQPIEWSSVEVYTKQRAMTLPVSFFSGFQGASSENEAFVYNSYWNQYSRLEIESKGNSTVRLPRELSAEGEDVVFRCDATGASFPNQGLTQRAAGFDASASFNRVRILDTRPGQKYFYVSKGCWGVRWYVLPMRSVSASTAIYDIAGTVLVEL